jgi:hypothetical protein
VPETLDGFGNRSQYGIRVTVPFEDKGFFLAGTAGADNLRSQTGEDPPGGSILKLTPQDRPVGPPIIPPPSNAGSGDLVAVGAAAG